MLDAKTSPASSVPSSLRLQDSMGLLSFEIRPTLNHPNTAFITQARIVRCRVEDSRSSIARRLLAQTPRLCAATKTNCDRGSAHRFMTKNFGQ